MTPPRPVRGDRLPGVLARSGLRGTLPLYSVAFDKDGYRYVGNGFEGRLILLDPSLQPVNDPFARSHLGGPTQVAFLRDAGAR